jgi:Domain of Unknown Function (DUF1080)
MRTFQSLFVSGHRLIGTLFVAIALAAAGCDSSKPAGSEASKQSGSQETPQSPIKTSVTEEKPVSVEPKEFLVDSEQLKKAELPEELLKQGWINLFDGQSLYGWFIVEKANWRIDDGAIRVDSGEKSLLCSSLTMSDCELQLDFKTDAKTNSGIFLRTPPSPGDVTEDCIELNIAPPDNPFPTGSLVQRNKLEPAQLGTFDTSKWHTYTIRMLGDKIEVDLDGKPVQRYTDDSKLGAGHIALQHNEGRAEFKNIRLRPLDRKVLKIDKAWEDDWTKSAKEGVQFNVEPMEGGLKITGGTGQVQSKDEWGDFLLQASYQIAKPEVNSGIFFRCIRDSILDGYECQINHAIKGDDPLQPADAGAGAIFRRQPARLVVGDGTKPTYLTIYARGSQLITWVNGIQVVDFIDTRPADENPRKGLRTAAGPIALQGHDATTEVLFKSIQVTELK